MKFSKLGKKLLATILVAAEFVSVFQIGVIETEARATMTQGECKDIVSTYSVTGTVLDYKDYLEKYSGAAYPDQTIEINAGEYQSYMEDDVEMEPKIYTDYEGMSGESVLTGENAYIEYSVNVLSVLYYPIEGKNSEIQRSFFIDGELPYSELSLIEFSRIWSTDITQESLKDGVTNILWNKDTQGNDMKPTSVEIPEWTTANLYDNNGYITDALVVYLTAGEHSIAINSQREPMLLRKIIFSNRKDAKSYDEVKKQWDENGATVTSKQNIVIEAENATKTSSQMLYPKQDQSSPAVYPSSAKALLNNTIGGDSWSTAGQWIEWEFEVAEDGYYNISMFDKQNFMRGIYVSRKITIDGEIPFAELTDYGFVYDSDWREDVLQDDDGNAYQFYLEAGTHTIRMEVVLGEFSDIISEVQDCVSQLNAIYRKVIRIIGVKPDTYRDYQIGASLPTLTDEMTAVKEQLDNAIASLRSAVGRTSDKETVLITMRDQLEYLIKDEERFVKVVSTYKTNVRACGTWLTQVISQPLQIDRIFISSPDVDQKITHNSFWDKLIYELKRLFYSFVIDYNSLGATDAESSENKSITLWIGTGRDQANVI